MTASMRRGRVRWWILAYMFGFALMAYVQRSSLSVAAERIMPELQLSQVQIGWLMWAFTATYAALQLPGGVFGQIVGARKTFFILGLLGVVAMVATPLAPWVVGGTALFVILLLAQALLGASQAPVFPVFTGVVEAWFPRQRWASVQGLQTAGMNIGAAVTPPVIVLLSQAYGWQGALLWIGLPSLALTLGWWWYGRDVPRQHPKMTTQELTELGTAAREERPRLTWARLRRVAADRNVLILTVSYMCMNYVFYLLQNWSFLYLIQERKFSVLQSGFLAMLPPIGAAIGSALGGGLTDRFTRLRGVRWGYRLVPLFALPLAGALLLLAVNVGNPYFAVAALALAYLAIELTEGAYWAGTMQVARADSMAAAGVLNTGGNLGGVIGIPIVAYLSAQGAWYAAFATGTAFALVAAAAWLMVNTEAAIDTHQPAPTASPDRS